MKYKKTIIIGTRKSLLALRQAEIVLSRLIKLFPECNFKIKKIVTSGDRLKKIPKKQIKGMFVKEIEQALLDNKIDIAVHSMKDLPTDGNRFLKIAAVLKRDKYNDVLISKSGKSLFDLKKGSRVGTSSPRRKMQLLLARNDLRIKPIKGNLDTRIKKMKKGEYDAIVVAAAGMFRLSWQNKITEVLSKRIMLPACAQGALALQIKRGNVKIEKIAKQLNDNKTQIEVTSEREFLQAMGGGCRAPVAALGKIKNSKLNLEGIVFLRKDVYFKASVVSRKNSPKIAAEKLAKKIKNLRSCKD